MRTVEARSGIKARCRRGRILFERTDAAGDAGAKGAVPRETDAGLGYRMRIL